MNRAGNFGAETRKRWQDFALGQKQEGTDYLNRYSNFINSQESLEEMNKRIQHETGADVLGRNAAQLNRLVSRTPENVRRQTLGFDATQGQVEAMTANRMGKLQPAAGEATTAAQNAQGIANTQMGMAIGEQERLEKPYGVEREMLSERQAREFTGFGQVEQRDLDGLLAKLSAGVTLTSGEMNRMTQLADQENSYRIAKYTADKQFEGTKYKSDQDLAASKYASIMKNAIAD